MDNRTRIVAAVALAAILGLSAASTAFGLTATEPFETAGEHPFVVPSGVTSVRVAMVGGAGGAGDQGEPGGVPATMSATIATVPGQTLYAEVAGDGGAANAAGKGLGGFGGGGNGGEVFALFASAASAGGGGGASDVQTCSISSLTCVPLASRLLVAGGGGGGGGDGDDGSNLVPGGGGGSAQISGLNGASDGRPGNAPGGGGTGATNSEGGAAGAGSSSTAGTFGVGGSGGGAILVGGGGGGGGGGVFGGGGGGSGDGEVISNVGYGSSGGGGGGGSSGVPSGAAGVSSASLVPTAAGAQPEVTFEWTLPSPAVITGSPTGVTSSTANLTGTINPNGSQITDCHFLISPAPPSGPTIACAQQVGAGSSVVAVSASLGGLSPSTGYTVTLLSGSDAGQSSGSPVTFATPSPTAPPGALPAISGLSVAAHVHRTVAKHKKPPVTISLELTLGGSLSLSFERASVGRRSHARCVATSVLPSRASRCARFVRVPGTLTVSARSGRNTIRFRGVLDRGKLLALGSYRLSVTESAAGVSVTAIQHPKFTLLR